MDIPLGQINNIKIEKSGDGITLRGGHKVHIADCPSDHASQELAVKLCEGRVLTGGLGLGLIVEKLVKKENVSEVIVVEILKELKTLVWPYLELNGKAKLIIGDFKHYLRTTEERFDWVYLDVHTDYESFSLKHELGEYIRLAERLVPSSDRVLFWGQMDMIHCPAWRIE